MEPRGTMPTGNTCRYSEFSRFDVVDRNGQSVGSVDDLVFDCNTGTIRHVLCRAGSVLGIGGKMLAVPFQAFDIRGNRLHVNRTKDELLNAPWMETGTTFGGPEWEQSGSTYWGEFWSGPHYGGQSRY